MVDSFIFRYLGAWVRVRAVHLSMDSILCIHAGLLILPRSPRLQETHYECVAVNFPESSSIFLSLPGPASRRSAIINETDTKIIFAIKNVCYRVS